MQKFKVILAYLISLTIFSGSSFANIETNGGLGHNPGPDKNTEMGRKMIQIRSTLPEHGYISDYLTDDQKFRKAWGAILAKTDYIPNSIKAIATGQDAVDDAELLKLPGTGHGYAQRTQAILNFIGLHYSISGNNASAQTIKAQYGMFGYPIIKIGADNKTEVVFEKYINTHQWAMFHGDQSWIRKHREMYWEWLIENNPQSLKLWILFGGFSHDAFAKFLSTRGFRVPTRLKAEDIQKYRVIETKEVFAGGNNNYPVVQTKNGEDFYEILLGKRPNYKSPADQEAILKAMKNVTSEMLQKIAVSGGGIADSGMIDPGQLGGYVLDKAEVLVDGKWVPARNSLRGLRLSNGKVIEHDIAFLPSQHPTAMGEDAVSASRKVNELFEKMTHLEKERGFTIPVDTDSTGKPFPNNRASRVEFSWSKAKLPLEIAPFGIPTSLIRPATSPDRMGPQVLIADPPSREDLAKFKLKSFEDLFDADKIAKAKAVQFTDRSLMNPNDLWSHPPRQPENEAQFSTGPSKELEAILKSNLDESILEPKSGMEVIETVRSRSGEVQEIDKTLRTHGLEAYNIKNNPRMGFFAHYRGTEEKPRAFVLADPADLEDRNTWVAHSGERGQYIQGILKEMGLGNSLFLLKTVPVEMMGADAAEWEAVRKPTEKYREEVIKAILAKGSVEIFIADGPVAQAEITRILTKLQVKHIPVVNVNRGENPADGILEAQAKIKKIARYARVAFSGKAAAIPHSDMSFLHRAYEGNAVGTVVRSNHPNFPDTYAVVIPDVVVKQDVKPIPQTTQSIKATLKMLEDMGIRKPGQSVTEYLKTRKAIKGERATTLSNARSSAVGVRCEMVFRSASGQ